MRNSIPGFTLLDLLVVIAIVAILSVAAIPYYQGYTVKARLTEVQNAMAVVKSAVSAYRLEKESSWPDCPSINEVRSSLGVGLGSISRISSLSIDSATGKIAATIHNVHSTVNEKTITLTPKLNDDGSLSWAWGWSEDFPKQFTPSPKTDDSKTEKSKKKS